MTVCRADWRVLEIEDPERPGEPHVVAVEARTSRVDVQSRLVQAEIQLAAYAIGGQLREMSSPHLLGSMGGRFLHSAPDNEFTLTGGGMQLAADARGLGIGTYLQNEVIAWATGLGEPGRIRPIHLHECDATTVEARDRRNRFYEQFGLEFDWSEPVNGIEHAAGRSKASLTIADVHALTAVHGVRVFQPMERALAHFVSRARDAEQARQDADRRIEFVRRDREEAAGTAFAVRRLLIAVAAVGWAVALVLVFVLGRAS